MYVIRHDDECVYANVREMIRNIRPTFPRDFAERAQNHSSIPDATKNVRRGADGDEIRAWA
jgi:hypothetical protein